MAPTGRRWALVLLACLAGGGASCAPAPAGGGGEASGAEERVAGTDAGGPGAAGADAPTPARRPSPADPRALPVDEPLERPLASEDCHRYRLALGRDEAVELVVVQRGVDVVVRVTGPGGGGLLELDSPVGREGLDGGTFLSFGAGEHGIEVCGTSGEGTYSLVGEGPRPATAEDRARAAILRRYAEGRELAAADRYEAALEAFEEARIRWRGSGDVLREAWAARKIGNISLAAGRHERAAEAFGDCAELYLRAGALRDAAVATSYRAYAFGRLERFDRAIAGYEKVAGLAEAADAPDVLTKALDNVAELHRRLGHTLESIRIYRRLERMAREAGDPSLRWRALDQMGKVYRQAGDQETARVLFERALDLARTEGLRGEEALTRADLGRVELDLGRPESACDHFGAALAHGRREGDPGAVAVALNNVGRCRRQAGEPETAEAAFEEALELARSSGDSHLAATIQLNLARLYQDAGRPQAALGLCRAARPELGDSPNRVFRAFVAACSARSLAALDRLVPAIEEIERAVRLVEEGRERSRIGSLRADLLAEKHDYYEMHVDLLLRLAERRSPAEAEELAAAAFEVAERSRARSLLDALERAASEAGELERVPRSVRRRDEVRAELLRVERRLLESGGGKTPPRVVEELRARRRGLLAEEELLDAEVRASAPSFAAYEAEPLNLEEIRRMLLADDEVRILAYFLGERSGAVWVVGRSSFTVARLPPRGEIAELVDGAVSALARSGRRRHAVRAELATEILAREILAPVAGALEGSRLAVIKHGPLHAVPFAALPLPSAAAGGGGGGLVGERFELVEVDSLSTAAALRYLRSHRPEPPRTLAVFADPVFRQDDERLGAGSGPASPGRAGRPPDPSTRRRRSSLESLERLDASRDEAFAIAELVDDRERLVVTGFEAGRDEVLSAPLRDFRILHFATHGLVHPDLSGILLSLYDRGGAPVDGLLRTWEIYGLDLRADLVVLGSCRSGLGRRLRGEGVLGLSRAFFYAGAARVLVSLWDVDDEATAALMKRFYHHLLEDGLPAAAALRETQRWMRSHPEWAAPEYWGAFVLQGDWG